MDPTITTATTTTPRCPHCDGRGVWPISPTHYCRCPAGQVAASRDAERERDEQRSRRWDAAAIPSRFAAYTLASHPDREAVASAGQWTLDAQGTNLLISGAIGCGKTGLAVGIARDLIETDVAGVLFASAPEMLDRMRPPALDDPMVGLQRIRVLILDDLGVEKSSDWVRERMYVLLNARYEAMRPTIVTSNLTLPRLATALGQRTISRFGEHVQVVSLTGRDRRAM